MTIADDNNYIWSDSQPRPALLIFAALLMLLAIVVVNYWAFSYFTGTAP